MFARTVTYNSQTYAGTCTLGTGSGLNCSCIRIYRTYTVLMHYAYGWENYTVNDKSNIL